MPSKHERRIMHRYDARRNVLDQQADRQKAAAKRNKKELEAPIRRQLIHDISENVARLLAICDENHWVKSELISVPRKFFGTKSVPALKIGEVLIPVKHLNGNVLVSQPACLTVSGDFFSRDYGEYEPIDLEQAPLVVLENILLQCRQLPKA